MLKCKLCPNKRHSKHWKCLYCKKCSNQDRTRWVKKNKTHLSSYRQANYQNYRDSRSIKTNQHTAEITDVYLRQVLCQHSTLNKADLTQELLDMKRLELQLRRVIRSNNAKNNGT
jgi:hypothetical protein